jgi:hypothetical protein
MGGGGVLSQFGSKFMLPIGTRREEREVSPPQFPLASRPNQFDPAGIRRSHYTPSEGGSPSRNGKAHLGSRAGSVGQRIFPCEPQNQWGFPKAETSQGYTTLNRIQSIVFPTAFRSNENLLVCGKPIGVILHMAMADVHAENSSHWCREQADFLPQPLLKFLSYRVKLMWPC